MTILDYQALAGMCVSQGIRDDFTFEQLSNYLQTGKYSNSTQVDIPTVAAQFTAMGVRSAWDIEQVKNFIDLTSLPTRQDTPANTQGWEMNLQTGPTLIIGGSHVDYTTQHISGTQTYALALDFTEYVVLQDILFPNLTHVANYVQIAKNLGLNTINLGGSGSGLVVDNFVEIYSNHFLTTLDISKLISARQLSIGPNPLLASIDLSSLSGLGGDVLSRISFFRDALTSIDVPNLKFQGPRYYPYVQIEDEAFLTSVSFASLDLSRGVIIRTSGMTSVSFPSLRQIGELTQGELYLQRNNNLISFDFSGLVRMIGGAIIIEENPSLVQARFQSLVDANGTQVTIHNNAVMLSITFNAISILFDLTVTYNPNLAFMSFPAITFFHDLVIDHNDGLTNLQINAIDGNSVTFTNNNLCGYLRFPNLIELAGSGIVVDDNAALDDIRFQSLQAVKSVSINNNPSCTILDLGSLTGWSDLFDFTTPTNISIHRCTSLTTADLTAFVPQNGGVFDFTWGVWTAAFINAFLAKCVANPLFRSGTVNFSVNTFGPTGQGVIDKATLIARGVNVITI